MVAALPAEQQVKAVADKLKERNPGFDGKVKHQLNGDNVVTELEFSTDNNRHFAGACVDRVAPIPLRRQPPLSGSICRPIAIGRHETHLADLQ